MRKIFRASLLSIMLLSTLVVFSQSTAPITSIGKTVPKETALTGIKSFETANPSAIKGHLSGIKTIQKLIDINNMAGIYIFRGEDDAGIAKIIFRAADANGEILPGDPVDQSIPCPPFCGPPEMDISAIGGPITEDLAQHWIENFKMNNPVAIESYLFGKGVFNKLIAQKNIAGIYFQNAINPEGKQVLILSGRDKLGNLNQPDYFDFSWLCPDRCPDDFRTTVKK